MTKRIIGLDIGGTKCAVLLAKIDGGIKIEDKLRFATRAERSFQETYGELCASIDAILEKNGLTCRDIAAIGVSCGGPLNSRTGMILCPPNLPNWVNVPITQLLQSRYGVAVHLQNDANACALVEWKLGAGVGTEDMVFLTMGTGMGAGIIAGGKLQTGHNDLCGEVGHIRLEHDGPIGFGKAGSFEGFTSGGGIARQAQAWTEKRVQEGCAPAWIREGHPVEQVDARLLSAYAMRGDVDALHLFEEVGKKLGQGVAVLIDVLNPEKIIIGSIFGRCEGYLRPAMEKVVRQEAIPYALEGLRIEAAKTGEQIGDYASIMVAMYGEGLEVQQNETIKLEAWAEYEQLFARYPELSVCKDSVIQAYEILRESFARDGKLLIAGNGGSCSDSEHIVGELMKGFKLPRRLDHETARRINELTADYGDNIGNALQGGLPAIALTSQTALNTAVQNDCGATLAYAQQVVGYGRKGDVFLGISTSGLAQNICVAALTAKAQGLKMIALTGRSGGKLKDIADCCIMVPDDTTAAVQEYHLPVYHALCAMLEAHFFGGQP